MNENDQPQSLKIDAGNKEWTNEWSIYQLNDILTKTHVVQHNNTPGLEHDTVGWGETTEMSTINNNTSDGDEC